MPWTLPLPVVSGVFISPWASTQIKPSGLWCIFLIDDALAATEPAARL
jgi:hypothetical protein